MKNPPGERVALQLLLTPCTHQSRLWRITDAVLDAGLVDRMHVLALRSDRQLPAQESRRSGSVVIHRLNVAVSRRVPGALRHPFQYLAWVVKILAFAFRTRPVLVQATSFESLPAAALVHWLRRVPMVYDAAELESEKYSGSVWIRALVRSMEKWLIGSADGMFVVGDKIADWYRDEYRIPRPTLVRNVPSITKRTTEKSGVLRRALGVTSETLVFLYQGALTVGRGIDPLLEAAQNLPDDRVVAFLGYGPLEARIRAAAATNPRVRFLEAVPPDVLLQYTADADMGLVLIEDICLSYRYSLPNKLFEAALCGVPVLVSPLPELEAFVKRRGAGFVTDWTPATIHQVLKTMTRERLEAVRAHVLREPHPDCWEDDARRVVESFRHALHGDGHGHSQRREMSPSATS